MATHDHPTISWADVAQERLATAGYRRGGARRAVVELMADRECALTAVEIEDALRGSERAVARASIYRVLDELEQLGLVAKIEVGLGTARYEAVHPDGAGHHHHLVCDDCGNVVPFSDEGLERAIGRVAGQVSFDVRGHDITLRGRCADCRS